ncbi:anthranilate synthase component I family protein [Marinicauda algicola]|uniref:anthranilate synthase component I family protein n=1 Tax=Marinicauda algicola TaxID=2029849 RepID=UPI001F145592|nr:anthranilate synthase component I family protein [Marinicauda algicola]
MAELAVDSPARLDWIAPEDALGALQAEPYTLLLHGGGAGARGRYSYLLAFPEFTIEGRGREAFEAARARYRPARLDGSGFAAGYAGLFAYDLACAFEAVPETPDTLTAWPHVALGWYAAAAVFDHDARRIEIRGEGEPASRLREVLSRPERRAPQGPAGTLAPVWREARYLDAARRAIEYVRAGDVFQVNLSHPFRGAVAGQAAPFAVFRRLVEKSPAAFSAFFRLDTDRVILTNSPERFVQIGPGGQVQTRPIKGTRARGASLEEDAALAAELLASDKDRAENLMIVDLMRNDLSRVCVPGSVRVPELFTVEGYSNVHHLVSTVEGRLEAGRGAFDLLAASFPPGSITGAPKPRAMEIIAELEGEARGPYCGALGWIDASGRTDLNVMIRTMGFVREGGRWQVEARSGGAITIESDPHGELAETHAKVAALRRAVEG